MAPPKFRGYGLTGVVDQSERLCLLDVQGCRLLLKRRVLEPLWMRCVCRIKSLWKLDTRNNTTSLLRKLLGLHHPSPSLTSAPFMRALIHEKGSCHMATVGRASGGECPQKPYRFETPRSKELNKSEVAMDSIRYVGGKRSLCSEDVSVDYVYLFLCLKTSIL